VPERLSLDFQFFKKLKRTENCPISDKFVRERTFVKSESGKAAILNKNEILSLFLPVNFCSSIFCKKFPPKIRRASGNVKKPDFLTFQTNDRAI